MSVNSALRQANLEALILSQQVTKHLQKHASTGTSTVPIPFLFPTESAEIWLLYEKLFLTSLRVGDDKSSHLCLEKLIERFGPQNERIKGLRGLYQEAVASNSSSLEKILVEYNEVLAEDPVNAVRSDL